MKPVSTFHEHVSQPRPIERQTARQPPTVFSGDEFLKREFPPRTPILGEWMTEKSLIMVHAYRGTGKTLFALSLAVAVCTGGSFAKWRAMQARRVVLVDGEMPSVALQERLRAITKGQSISDLHIIADDIHPDGIPDLATDEGQNWLNPTLQPGDVLILDNISCLFRSGGDENEERSWRSAANWLRNLRRRGVSVLLIHHSGKGGAQRGTSKREDLLDTVIRLKAPEGHTADDGAVFEVHFEKSRGVHGEAVKSVLLTYQPENTESPWRCELLDRQYEEVLELLNEGKSIREVARELGISKSKVERLRRKAKENGDLAGVSASRSPNGETSGHAPACPA